MGIVLRKAREDADLSQTEFAPKIGVDQSTLSRWELGQGGPNMINRWAPTVLLAEKALALPRGQLFRDAGLLEEDGGGVADTRTAITRDPNLTRRHRRALALVYDALVATSGDEPDDDE